MLGSAAGNSNNIRSKFFELKNLVLMGKDRNLQDFLEYLEKRFPDLLNIKEFKEQNMASKKRVANIK